MPEWPREHLASGTAAVRGIKVKKQYDFSRGKRGAVIQTPPGKTRITIRIDDDVLEWFREQVNQAGGGNYQTLIQSIRTEYLTLPDETLVYPGHGPHTTIGRERVSNPFLV